MRQALVLFLFIAGACFHSVAQSDELTPSSLPDFLSDYERSLIPLDAAYADLANETLAPLDEKGQPLGHRPIENRRQAIADLRQTLHRLTANPQDLLLTTTLFIQTETMADDLFDLSQIAYDNDREELGKRLSDLMTALDRYRDGIESYMLSLARDAQERLGRLERENRDLQQKLKEAAKPPKAAAPVGRPATGAEQPVWSNPTSQPIILRAD